MKDIFKLLQERKSKNEFGYGLCTAEPYVRKCLDMQGAMQTFHVDSSESLLKHAQEVLAYASPEMVAEKKATSKFDDLLPKGVDAPDNTIMVIRHVLTTTKEDRDNDILETSGAQLDPKAPLLWQHMHTMPIGKVLGEAKRTKDSLSVISAIVGGEKQTPLNDLAHDAATLVEADVLRFSHGFRALEFEMREQKDDDEFEWPGFHITKFEVMEASLVSVPSNSDAGVQEFASQKLKSDFFKSMQKQCAARTKPQVRGIELEDDSEKDTQLLLKLGGAEVTVTTSKTTQPASTEKTSHSDTFSEEPETTSNINTFSEEPEKGCHSDTLSDESGKTSHYDTFSEEPEKELTYSEAAAFVIANATDDQLEKLKKTIDAMLSVRELDQKASQYRALAN